MISLKRLIINPKSPDKALQQAYSEAEAAPARIAHVNRLSRDILDIKNYTIDMDVTTVQLIKSKRGIIEIVNADPSLTSLTVYLQSPEIEQDHEKFYIQLTAYSNNYNVTPIVVARGISSDLLQLEIKNLDAADDWGLLYFYYELVKID
jgi:hypothetical protein